MRRLPERVWHLLMMTLWGLPLVTPLFRWTAVPCTHDGHLHYHRIAAMRHAWENGLFFSRWLPDLAFGYGYPFFVYREPVPLYASLIPHLLGVPLPAAENLLYIVCIWAAGWFMYLWVRDLFGARAGLVAGLAYMAAPYVLVDALIRGNSPESVALPLLPLLLWIGRRWLVGGSWRSFVAAVLALALLSLSHNISLLLFTPFLLVYLVMIGWLHEVRWRVTAVRLLLLFGLGLGMTSFYTGGALLEMDAVTLSQSTTTRNNDFHYNFATLGEIFAPVPIEDPSLLNPPLPFRLGWVPVALAVLGVARWLVSRKGAKAQRADREQDWHVGLMVGVTAVYLFLALPASLWLWENIPLIDFTQFPWRFVGRAALPLAMLAGVGLCDLRFTICDLRFTPYVLRFTFYAALVLLVLEALPLLYPAVCEEPAFPTINTVHRYEAETGLVGVDPEGSYFPVTVEQRPQTSPLVADYGAGGEIARWDTAVFPADTAIVDITYENLAAAVHVDAPEPFTARYLTFAFPGWTAVVDGEPVPIEPSDPEGLITFAVPAGEHTLAVRWQSTPLRTVLLGLSVMALAGVVVTAVVLGKGQVARGKEQGARGKGQVVRGEVMALVLVGAGLLLGKVLWVDRGESLFRRPSVPDLAVPLAVQGDGLRLWGYNLNRTEVESGGLFDVDMAWTAVAPPSTTYQTNVWLVDEAGLVWSDKETQRPRLYEDVPPTPFWQPGQWAWDSREVAVLPGTPPGEYRLLLTLFVRESLQPVTLTDVSTGVVLGPTAVLGTITVTPPPAAPEFAPQYRLETAVGSAQLLGYNQDRQVAEPGEPVLLTFFWAQSAGERLPLSLQLGNEVVRVWEVVLPNGRYRSQHLVTLPASLESGAYTFDLDGVALGQLQVNAPPRIFTQPGVATAVNTPFTLPDGTPQATLIGYTLSPLTLLWQANAEMTTSYRVFVHLVDENGTILAQADGEPANWTRPTTGWAVGEFIVDEHQLAVPAERQGGELSLRVGLYEAETGERLRGETADYVTILLPP
ncbi:MAG: glycosyltransferase family 39 protein [Ardenticatenaceae bacterium]|nr:glycosyltransferase family 39 protein [Ardenticatenaceae bacterium]